MLPRLVYQKIKEPWIQFVKLVRGVRVNILGRTGIVMSSAMCTALISGCDKPLQKHLPSQTSAWRKIY